MMLGWAGHSILNLRAKFYGWACSLGRVSRVVGCLRGWAACLDLRALLGRRGGVVRGVPSQGCLHCLPQFRNLGQRSPGTAYDLGSALPLLLTKDCRHRAQPQGPWRRLRDVGFAPPPDTCSWAGALLDFHKHTRNWTPPLLCCNGKGLPLETKRVRCLT